MKTEVVDASPTRKEIRIEIDADEVRAEMERVTNEYARAATVPGFRKGHAPAAVVRTRYKKDIQGEVLSQMVPRAVERAIIESGLNVIGQPDIHFEPETVERMGKEPLSLHAHVEVLPDVELGEYKGLAAARRRRPVTDEAVERIIENLRESSASLQPVEDRPSAEGDTVTVDIQGRYLNPPEDEDITAEDVDIVLGSPGVLPIFNEHLTGVQADEVRTFTVEYPDDFTSKGLAGKTIEYTATVTAVRRKELPVLDDEWVKSLGEEEIDTVERLRERIRENLTKSSEHESEHRLRDEILSSLIEQHRFEVPETLVSYQANQMVRQMLNDMMQRGVDPRRQDMNWEAMRDVVRERATDDLRGSLLLERIADAEQIEVSDEEVEDEINAIIESSGQPAEQVRASLTKEGGERSIADRLRNRKALDFLVQHAAIREEEWREEEDEETADESDATAGDEAVQPAASGSDESPDGEAQSEPETRA